MGEEVGPGNPNLPLTEGALTEAVFVAPGAASTCWENVKGAGVFESTRAKEIGEKLVKDVKSITAFGLPSLGLATNMQLLDELQCRFRMGHTDAEYRAV